MLQMTITSAGLDALVDAQNGVTDPIVIAQMGISEASFVPAPTLTAVPGELKRIGTLSGVSVAENVIHLTAQDSSTDSYTLRGFGLFLADGTLFAVYSQPEPVVVKVDIAALLVSFDVGFIDAVDTAITFGGATFLFPPATETVRGAIEIATQAEVNTGTDDERALTPLKLATRLTPVLSAIAAETAARIAAIAAETAARVAALADEATARATAIATLTARTITGGGLATGGGDLTANRVITVTAASAAEIVAGTEADKAVTPLAMRQVDNGYGSNISIRGLGGAIIKMGTVSVSIPGGAGVVFPVAFPVACDAVLLCPLGNLDDADERDEPWWVSSQSAAGFNIGTFDDGNTVSFRWVAFGR